MGYLDYAGLQYLWGKLKEKFAPKSHSHDDRYYTEAEMDGKLNSKVNNNEAGANGLINKLSTADGIPNDATVFISQHNDGETASYYRRPISTLWTYIKGKADGVYQPKGSYAVSGHTHDDRYYTESEMNTKLSGKSNTDHTHKNVNDIGTNKPTTFAYSKSGMNYGDYSWLAGWNGYELRAVNKNQFAIADHTHPTSEIYGGNVNYSGYAGPIESAHIDVLRANRLAFLPASGIKVEYSVDGGATWIDYGATDDQKASLFAMRMGSAASFYTGKHTKADECTIKDQLRITVTPVDRYASVNMLYLWVSVAGTSATVNISRSTIGAKETFTDVRTDVPISGWSGPNEIRFSGGTFGGGSTQTSNAYAYRFTFKNKADGKGSVRVMDIRMYGPSAWGVPNNMMEKDHIYNWDANQNVHFPAQVTATRFNGSSTGVVDYGNSNGSTIKIGFGGAGLTKDKLTHIAGYAKDGNQTVIKDVSKGVLQSWLDLGASAYKKVQSLSAVGHSNWTNQSTDDGYVPTMAFMAFWNGAFNGSGNSNLQYCDRGRFGTIVTKNSGDYAAAGHTHDMSMLTGNIINTEPATNNHKIVLGKSGLDKCEFYEYGGIWNFYKMSSGEPNLVASIQSDGIHATLKGTADAANSVDWSKIQNKPSSYPPASHSHAYLPLSGGTMSGALNFANCTWNHVGGDVQIGDHNTSGSFYIQGLNGPTNIKLKKKGDTSTGTGDSATITYDGGNLIIDKTIQANLSGNASTATKAVSADKATSASSADKAAKLTTARTVSGGSDITLSFNYDGSGNSTANIGFYSCKHSIGNTNNYPFHRFAKLDANKNAWVDNSMTFLISQDYSGGGYGICRLVYRSNADSSSASLAAEWLVRKGLSVDTVQVAIKTDKTNGAYCDAFYKSSGGYMSVVIRAIASGGRASLGRTWTLINSNETDGTTATDKKTSSECWKTIADAGNELHKQAYSSSASAIDGGYVASAGSANSASSCAGNSASATKLTSSAGSATQPVYFKDGKPVAGTYTLGDASSKMVRTLSAQGNSGWTNKTTDDKYVPTMSFMAYWNGAYGGTSSNLQYCDRGRFGTIVTKNSGDYAAASHTHNYAGSGSAGGSANSAIKLDSSAGSATQPVYFSGGKPVAIGYTIAKSVPADAKFTDTDTWRGIQNNLTSDSTDQSLSAAQGKALKTLVDGKAPTSHNHTKSQITDFPSSMPASDVSAWAKAATKPSYTKAEVGLSNVDNTADKDKSVKYAASAGSASQLNGFTIQASTSDLTAGYSRLNNNVIYIVYE